MVCPQTLKVLNENMQWDGCQDEEAYERALIRCNELYKSEAPCLKVFIKVEQGVYRAICGKEKQ
jgi:hypothetical protein